MSQATKAIATLNIGDKCKGYNAYLLMPSIGSDNNEYIFKEEHKKNSKVHNETQSTPTPQRNEQNKIPM